jgi:hypothetical protein
MTAGPLACRLAFSTPAVTLPVTEFSLIETPTELATWIFIPPAKASAPVPAVTWFWSLAVIVAASAPCTVVPESSTWATTVEFVLFTADDPAPSRAASVVEVPRAKVPATPTATASMTALDVAVTARSPAATPALGAKVTLAASVTKADVCSATSLLARAAPTEIAAYVGVFCRLSLSV